MTIIIIVSLFLIGSSFVPPLVRWINWGHFKLFNGKPQSRVNQSYKVGSFLHVRTVRISSIEGSDRGNFWNKPASYTILLKAKQTNQPGVILPSLNPQSHVHLF